MSECENWSTENEVCQDLSIPECASCAMYVPKVDDNIDDLVVAE